MHVQHHAAERGSQIIRQVFIGHASQDQVHIQLTRNLVDCQVLSVQTHPGKQVQLVSVAVEHPKTQVVLPSQVTHSAYTIP